MKCVKNTLPRFDKKNSVYPVPTLIYIRKRTIIIYNGIDLTRGSQNRQGDR